MSSRRGFTLLELSVAAILILGVAVMVLQMTGAVSAAARAIQTRRAAAQEAANVMELLTSRPWDQLPAGPIDPGTLTAQVRQAVPEARLEIEVASAAGPPEAKRIAVRVLWPAGDERPDHAVGLVAWKYRRRQ